MLVPFRQHLLHVERIEHHQVGLVNGAVGEQLFAMVILGTRLAYPVIRAARYCPHHRPVGTEHVRQSRFRRIPYQDGAIPAQQRGRCAPMPGQHRLVEVAEIFRRQRYRRNSVEMPVRHARPTDHEPGCPGRPAIKWRGDQQPELALDGGLEIIAVAVIVRIHGKGAATDGVEAVRVHEESRLKLRQLPGQPKQELMHSFRLADLRPAHTLYTLRLQIERQRRDLHNCIGVLGECVGRRGRGLPCAGHNRGVVVPCRRSEHEDGRENGCSQPSSGSLLPALGFRRYKSDHQTILAASPVDPDAIMRHVTVIGRSGGENA